MALGGGVHRHGEARENGISSMFRQLVVGFFLLSCALSFGQEVNASVSGVVTDASGAPVPGAEVKALRLDTGEVRSTRTNAEGVYSFPALAIGAYEISAGKEGFKRAVRQEVTLHLGARITIDLLLEVGALSQEVTVSEQAVPLQTESAEKSSVLYGEQIRELQLNGRSFFTLLELLPGVASDLPDRADPNSSPSLSINGARSSSSAFHIDGSNNADVIVGSSSLNTFTSVDTIAEVNVVTSTFNAEYGRGGFSQVNVVTRGGTSRYKASLYHFLRNDALDARDYFTHQRLPLKLNNFGYNVGGPVAAGPYNRSRNKTFFFFAQEFNYTTTRGEAILTRVPTAAERRGDFRELGPGRDGQWGTSDDPVLDPRTRLGIPGGQIPREAMNANALKLIELYPLPNYSGIGVINYASAAASKQTWREEMIRIDHNFTDALRMYGRYTQDTADIKNPYGGSGLTSVTTRFPGLGASRSDRPGKNVVLNATYSISPSLLNEFSANYAARHFRMWPTGANVTRQSLGLSIGELFPDEELDVFPTISLGSSYAALTAVRRGAKDLFNSELSNNVTKISGKHIVKAGVYYNFGGNREQQFNPTTNGSFSFTTNNTGNPVANFLLGLPFSYTEARNLIVSRVRFGALEWFVQDSWKVRPNLTINFGVRNSSYQQPYDMRNVMTNFVPALWNPAKAPEVTRTGQRVPGTGDELNGVIISGVNSPYGRRVAENHWNLWAPRLGIAWAPTRGRKLVLRTGYGISYTRPLIGAYINGAFNNPPFAGSVTINNPQFDNPAVGTTAAEAIPSLTANDPRMKAPSVQQWSFSLSRQLVSRTVLEVSYVGSKGTHWMRPFNINNPAPGLTLQTGLNVNALRPYRGWGNITERRADGNSNYHSLQVTVNRRVKDLTAGFAYTWAKAIDDGSDERASGDVPPNSLDERSERAVADYDRTHVFNVNYIYNLPRIGRGAFARAVLNGWQISGITRLWTGRPLDITMSSDVAGIGNVQNQRPSIAGNPWVERRTAEQWFRRDVFLRPQPGTFGNLGRNALRGPGLHKWDLSVFRNWRFEGGRSIQFRAEAFNAFNHPIFSTVGTTLRITAAGADPSADNFGVVTGTRDARVLQFGLKMYF